MILVSLAAALLANAAAWALIVWRIEPSELPVPLHYNIYFGIDLIGPWWHLYLIPFSGTALICINLVLSFILYTRLRLPARFLVAVAAALQVAVLAATMLIVIENLSQG